MATWGVPCSRSTVWRSSTNFKSHLFPGRLCIFCGSGGSGIYLNPFLDFKSVLFFTVHTAVGRVVNLSDGEPVRSFCISSIALSWRQTIFKSHAAGASCGFCLFKTLQSSTGQATHFTKGPYSTVGRSVLQWSHGSESIMALTKIRSPRGT